MRGHWLTLGLSGLFMLAGCAGDDEVINVGADAGGPPRDAGGDASGEPPGTEVSFRKITLHRDFYCEGAAIGDLDGDAQADVIAGPHWYAGPNFMEQHALWEVTGVADIYGYSACFFQWTRDLDGDGALDVLVVGFPGEQGYWLKNPGLTSEERDGTWARHPIAEMVDTESPEYLDLVGDDEPELLFASDGKLVYAQPAAEPEAPWVLHPITDARGFAPFTHGLGASDINGDGRMDVLEKSAWWEQPASLDGDPVWVRHEHGFGPGGGQMFGDDIDDDGDIDVATTLAAHGYGLAWYEQTDDGVFTEHIVVPPGAPEPNAAVIMHEPHALAQVDVDGDGLLDMISGERHWGHVPEGEPEFDVPARLYWFQRVRDASGARYVPWLIDDDSGTGTQLTVGDVNDDQRPDIVIANKKGAFVFVQE
jgi:hypothetical protein